MGLLLAIFLGLEQRHVEERAGVVLGSYHGELELGFEDRLIKARESLAGTSRLKLSGSQAADKKVGKLPYFYSQIVQGWFS